MPPHGEWQLNRDHEKPSCRTLSSWFHRNAFTQKDKQTSLEVFGRYIDTYKFQVKPWRMRVVLDLVYEARGRRQRLGSEEKIDAWFHAKLRVLRLAKSSPARAVGAPCQTCSVQNLEYPSR